MSGYIVDSMIPRSQNDVLCSDVKKLRDDLVKKKSELESATKKDEVPIKGFSECCNYLKAFASNGIVMNSFLLWVSIKRLTTAEDTWKEESIARFLPEEITAANTSEI